jgi:hypothetical protein
MRITDEMIDKYVETIAEESKQYNNGEVCYAYITGGLKCQLKWALGGELQRKIAEEGILQAIAEENV